MFQYPETRDIECPEYSDLPTSWLLKRDNLLLKRFREKERKLCSVQCVSLDSPVLFYYPEIKAVEVTFSDLEPCICSFYIRIHNKTGGVQRNTLYSMTDT